MTREGCTEKVTFEQIPEGGEAMSCVYPGAEGLASAERKAVWSGVSERKGEEELRSEKWAGCRLCRALLAPRKTLAFSLSKTGSPWRVLSRGMT